MYKPNPALTEGVEVEPLKVDIPPGGSEQILRNEYRRQQGEVSPEDGNKIPRRCHSANEDTPQSRCSANQTALCRAATTAAAGTPDREENANTQYGVNGGQQSTEVIQFFQRVDTGGLKDQILRGGHNLQVTAEACVTPEGIRFRDAQNNHADGMVGASNCTPICEIGTGSSGVVRKVRQTLMKRKDI